MTPNIKSFIEKEAVKHMKAEPNGCPTCFTAGAEMMVEQVKLFAEYLGRYHITLVTVGIHGNEWKDPDGNYNTTSQLLEEYKKTQP